MLQKTFAVPMENALQNAFKTMLTDVMPSRQAELGLQQTSPLTLTRKGRNFLTTLEVAAVVEKLNLIDEIAGEIPQDADELDIQEHIFQWIPAHLLDRVDDEKRAQIRHQIYDEGGQTHAWRVLGSFAIHIRDKILELRGLEVPVPPEKDKFSWNFLLPDNPFVAHPSPDETG